jgi:hypothetical protein
MIFRCTICGKEFEIPPDAEKIGRCRGGSQMYRFSDGTIHVLMSTNGWKEQQQ